MHRPVYGIGEENSCIFQVSVANATLRLTQLLFVIEQQYVFCEVETEILNDIWMNIVL
jgi:hypothetical protein